MDGDKPLKRDLAAFIVADTDRLIDLRPKDLAVDDGTGPRRRRNRRNGLIKHLVLDHQLQLHLG